MHAYTHIGIREESADAQDAADLLRQLWEAPRSSGPARAIPAPNPVSILRKDLPKLRQQPYHVSAKLDGTRYLLLLGYNETTAAPYAFLVDRNATFFRVHIRGVDDEALRQGTLLDGELMPRCATFVAFDIVAAKGVDCKMRRYSERLQVLEQLLPTLRMREGTLALKPCRPLQEIGQVTSEWSQDGLIFMPENDPIQTGMHRTMFKWKAHNTIDFSLAMEQGQPQLYYVSRRGPAPIHTLQLQLQSNDMLQQACSQAPCIVECECTAPCHYEGYGEVRILAIRQDKNVANYERTVRLTLQNIRESITHEELVQWCTT